jgi:hypothetical protein
LVFNDFSCLTTNDSSIGVIRKLESVSRVVGSKTGITEEILLFVGKKLTNGSKVIVQYAGNGLGLPIMNFVRDYAIRS